ncbi:MAG: hypothetical protein HQK49_13260 [Oligoflexia bacterium]|nr:hypothetical protein [Oligoflexia bacterium]
MKNILDLPHAPMEIMRNNLSNLIPKQFQLAPKCCAYARTSGSSCKSPAMSNGRCRMHGGKSTGPKTPDGLERAKKGNWKHGDYSSESLMLKKEIRQFMRKCRLTIEEVD